MISIGFERPRFCWADMVPFYMKLPSGMKVFTWLGMSVTWGTKKDSAEW